MRNRKVMGRLALILTICAIAALSVMAAVGSEAWGGYGVVISGFLAGTITFARLGI